MTINFIIKTPVSCAKTAAKQYNCLTKVYVRLRDGRTIDQTATTNIIVSPKAWDCKLELLNPLKCPEELEWEKINDAIMAMRKHITKKYISDNISLKVGPRWLKESLEDYLGTGTRYQFGNAFDEFLLAHDLSESRLLQYEVLRRLVLRFCMYSNKTHDVKDAVRTDIRSFTSHTLSSLWTFTEREHIIFKEHPEFFEAFPDKREPRQRGKNTINDLFKKLRTFFHWCKDSGIMPKNPFDTFKVGADLYGTPVYITLDEVRTIYEADLSDCPRLARQRDVFVFQCCVGCRVGDLLKFKKSNLIDDSLQYIPHKTISKNPKTIIIPLNSTARAIAERYANSSSDKLLPFISTQKYNEAIKEIFQRVGITRTVTVLDTLTRQERKVSISEIASSHMARRTFAGNLYKKVKDPNLISSMTGHSDGSRAFSRYRSIDDDMKKELVGILD